MTWTLPALTCARSTRSNCASCSTSTLSKSLSTRGALERHARKLRCSNDCTPRSTPRPPPSPTPTSPIITVITPLDSTSMNLLRRSRPTMRATCSLAVGSRRSRQACYPYLSRLGATAGSWGDRGGVSIRSVLSLRTAPVLQWVGLLGPASGPANLRRGARRSGPGPRGPGPPSPLRIPGPMGPARALQVERTSRAPVAPGPD